MNYFSGYSDVPISKGKIRYGTSMECCDKPKRLGNHPQGNDSGNFRKTSDIGESPDGQSVII